jgi:hypothetical protein
MSGSWRVGANDYPSESEVEFLHQGLWYSMPLVPQSRISRSPMSPFSPAIQRGNDQRVVDQRLNVIVWDDWSGGFGEKKSMGEESLKKYWYGNLDTRSKNTVTVPPAINNLGDSGGAITAPPIYGLTARKASLDKNILLYGPNQLGIRFRDGTTLVWSVKLATAAVYDILSFRGKLYASTWDATNGFRIQVSTDAGASWTIIATMVAKGIVSLDTRLFTYNFTDSKLYASADGVTWTVASEEVWMDTGESIQQLVRWSSPDGSTDTVYILTNYQVRMLEEEPGFIHDFWYFDGVIDGVMPRAHAWRRNNLLYISFFKQGDLSALVISHAGGTDDNVGPRKVDMSVPDDRFFSVTHTFGNIHELFAWGTGGVQAGTGLTSRGLVMSMNDLGGWHPVVDGNFLGVVPGESYIYGGFYDSQVVYTILANGRVYSSPSPDRRIIHPATDVTLYDTQEHSLVSSKENGGLKNIWKVGAYFLVDTELQDGTHGIPIGSTIRLCYRADGGAPVCLPLMGATESYPVALLSMLSLKANSLVFPAVQILPAGTQQVGAPFKELTWELFLKKTPGGNAPVVTEISLYYSLWLEQFYSLQFNIDFTKETWERYPGNKYQGKDRETLLSLLDTVSRTRGYIQIRFGLGNTKILVPAADMLVSYRLDANTGSGVAQVSARDLTAVRVS